MAQLTRVQIEKMKAYHRDSLDLLNMIEHYNGQIDTEKRMGPDADFELLSFFDDQISERESRYAELMLQFQKFLHENIPA